MFWSLVHLILSLRISYPDLIKFPYFADTSQEANKASNEMRGCNNNGKTLNWPGQGVLINALRPQ
jgi:hypothetical protein